MSCPDCFRGGAATGTPNGTTKMLHGFKTYIASPPSLSPSPSNSTIILYTDAFGHHLPNNLLLADALSTSTGLTVLVPDIIPGGGMSPAILPFMDTFSSPAAGVLSKAWAIGRAMVHVIPFFMRASPQSEQCTASCLEYARKVKEELGDGGKVGVAGYCWGGYQALYIARQEREGQKVVDAVFVAHPARFEPAHASDAVDKGVKVSFAHAGDDMALPMGKVEETKSALEGSKGFEIRVYEGCVHGFAVRATPGKEREASAADEALRQAVEWFEKWL
ncbi:alpha/beta-hydrolase [Macroventuria anomochaeta]|uniref:Alpha/beta-hydrolase n=1 Tax=Macroventuria anomochaeta TaxID=301207 RepID=A0ACB6S6S4_9PLEO|nr:alpha/beta-hydrolase [Macroventuria anomochaeta]KAF2629668.1 alpha/beta-hydrolase [Macroventuria anomochaeta]